MDIDLKECRVDHIKYGKVSPDNIDQYVFAHYNYFLYHEDKFVGHLFEEYKNAFVVFEINNN